jgi:DUF2934 family protein
MARTTRKNNVGSFQQPEQSRKHRPDGVARRAYELYEARGSEPGRDVDDWLQAERELQAFDVTAS